MFFLSREKFKGKGKKYRGDIKALTLKMGDDMNRLEFIIVRRSRSPENFSLRRGFNDRSAMADSNLFKRRRGAAAQEDP
jgi:hypothetical protein